MKLTAVFEPAKAGGYTCFLEEIPAAISQGDTLPEAKANLMDALKLVLACQRELAEKDLEAAVVGEQAAQAVPEDRVVVGDQDADAVAASGGHRASSGSRMSRREPPPVEVAIVSSPPRARTRSLRT